MDYSKGNYGNINMNSKQEDMLKMMNEMMGITNSSNKNDIILFIFTKSLFPNTPIQANKNEVFATIIEKYKVAAKDFGNNVYYYNNRVIDPNLKVINFNLNNSIVYIQVISSSINTIISSINSDLAYSLTNNVSMDFEENGKTIPILVNINARFLTAMNEYETQTDSKGQNDYFANEKQIDPYKTPMECGILSNFKIKVKKKIDTIEIISQMNNNNGLNLWFKKKNFKDFLIQGKYNELVQTQVNRYLIKFYCPLNNNQIQENNFSYFYMGKRLNLNQTVSQSGLKNDSEILVEEPKKIINVQFRLDSQKTNIVTSPDETIGELISKFKRKRNLNENENYKFIYNAKILDDQFKTLEELYIENNGVIDVFPPGIIGAK